MELPDNGFAPHGTRVLRALILGAPGSGKTTFAVPLVHALAPKRDRVLCVGPVPTLSIKLGVPQHDLSTTDRDRQEEFFRKVLKTAQDSYPEGERLMVIDEADLYFSSAGRTYGSKGLQEIVNIGRNFFLSQVYIARGTSDIAKNCVAAANVVFIGQTTEPNLLDYARRFMPAIPTEALRDFPPHRFIVYAPNRVPHVLGVAWEENGQIACADWSPTSETDEPSPTSTEGGEADSPDDTASIPDAAEPSPTGTGPASAENTEPKGSAKPTDSERPRTG